MPTGSGTDGDDRVGEIEERVDDLLAAFVATLQRHRALRQEWPPATRRPPARLTTAPARRPVHTDNGGGLETLRIRHDLLRHRMAEQF
jgi:hypothetical protein